MLYWNNIEQLSQEFIQLLNLYRMLYWNTLNAQYVGAWNRLNLYRMLYWNSATTLAAALVAPNWTYTECCIEIFYTPLRFYNFADWTYTECCIEIPMAFNALADMVKLNLYRMLYWNSNQYAIALGYVGLNLYRMLYWNIKKRLREILLFQNWTYTECCIEIESRISFSSTDSWLNLYRMLYWNAIIFPSW